MVARKVVLGMKNVLSIFNTIDSLTDQYVNIWEDVCNIESPSLDKEAVDRVGSYFIRMAESIAIPIKYSSHFK